MDSIYNGVGIMHQRFQKRAIIINLREVTFTMVEESSDGIECTKNRYGGRTLDLCKSEIFERVKLSEIEEDVSYIRTKYYGKNIWLLLDE